MKAVRWVDLGRMEYRQALDWQMALNRHIRSTSCETGYLLFVEHPPVVTLGRNQRESVFRLSGEAIRDQGIEIVGSNRGGSATYHGPGQVVGYLIVDLARYRKDIRWYVHSLEEWVIQALAKWGVIAGRKSQYPGIWVGDEKIGALGVALKRWVTLHGFALNVNPAMEHFDVIHPCGIREYGVTSLQRLGVDVAEKEVVSGLVAGFPGIFGTSLKSMNLKEVKEIVQSAST